MPLSLQSASGLAPKGRQRIDYAVETFSSQNILLLLVALRIVNSLSTRTFFQPDEYFQSLEPAWQMVFGEESGAWITWEWKNQLRSSIHPAAFAGVYYISSNIAGLLSLSPRARAELLLAAPKVAQAVIAALGDYYTWKLGERVYGRGSRAAWATGFPLLLTTALPFGLLGVWRTLRGGYFISLQLAITILFVTLTLSLISHKEVRFIYPILPALHIIAAETLVTTVFPSQRAHFPPSRDHAVPSARKLWKFILSILLAINVLIALYTSLIHQSGVIKVLTYLRTEHESRNTNTTIGFLMPCHSTPWRSHLVHPTIRAWALTCEPPVNLPPAARKAYLDEADIFYNDPSLFLRSRFAPPPMLGGETQKLAKKRQWPDYIVFFEQLRPTMEEVLEGSGYVECWRWFNTHWHDDWRRKGDVIVWCLRGS